MKNWTNMYEVVVKCQNCGRQYVEDYYTEEAALEQYSKIFLENHRVGVRHDKKARIRKYLIVNDSIPCCLLYE